jgi:YidC/Oxa1 family membrane protein insertase
MDRITGTSAHPGVNEFTTNDGWLGFGDKYWLTALIPPNNQQVAARFAPAGDKRYQADYAGQAVVVAPGKQNAVTSRFFAGAKEVAVLDAYEASRRRRLRSRHRLGLVRVVREADLLSAGLAVPPGRQFRRRDHPA